MVEFGNLAGDGIDDPRMRVTMNVCPDRAVAVNVAATAAIGKKGPLSGDDDQGFLGAPCQLLGEGVPETAAIYGCKLLCVPAEIHLGSEASICLASSMSL